MSLTRLKNPTGGQIRGMDKYGSGAFGAPRSRDGVSYIHHGVDLLIAAPRPVWCPCSGVVTGIALAYPGDDRYHSIHIQPDADLLADLKLLYVEPVRRGTPYLVKVGDVLGVSEDLSAKYPEISQHCHVELRIAGEVVDPTPLIFPTDA